MFPKVGFVFSGAAAFIGQEAALCFALTEGFSPWKRKIRPDVIAGTSSGALNAVVLNAILRTRDGKATPGQEFFWGFYPRYLKNPFYKRKVRPLKRWLPEDRNYFSVLADLHNTDVFRLSLTAFTQGGVLDNSPLRRLLERIVNETLGLRVLGDLYLPTYLTAVDRSNGKPVRFYSRNPEHANLDLVDILMASSAIPIVFPPQKIFDINNLSDDHLYFDGGTGPDSTPVEALAGENCDELFIINRMGSTEEAGHRPVLENHKDSGINAFEGFHLDIIENTAIALEYLFQAISFSQIQRALEIAKKAYIYEPVLPQPYSILNFENEKEQWVESWHWARKHAPELITQEYVNSARDRKSRGELPFRGA